MKRKKIIFTGGGTGGHVTPLVSLHNYLKDESQHQYLWLGQRDSLEETIAEKNNIEFKDISAGKIRRYFDWRNFYEPLKNLTGVFEALYHIIRFRPDAIISKGGFVALPVCIAGFFLRKKIYIHESDTVMGLANKISSLFAKKIFYSFEPKEKGKKHIHAGHIMNPDMLDSVSSVSKQENERLNVIVIAGSQGSENICQHLIKILGDMKSIDFHIILGTNDNLELRAQLSNFPNARTYGFVGPRELAKLYGVCDIAITRGSSSIWEQFYFGIHSIIIPLSITGGNHQYHNAVYFNERYGSDILEETENLHFELFRKLQKYKELRKTGLNLDGFLDGVKAIAEEI